MIFHFIACTFQNKIAQENTEVDKQNDSDAYQVEDTTVENPDRIVTGLVTQVYPDKMCVMTNNTKQWWTRFVNCQVISYT